MNYYYFKAAAGKVLMRFNLRSDEASKLGNSYAHREKEEADADTQGHSFFMRCRELYAVQDISTVVEVVVVVVVVVVVAVVVVTAVAALAVVAVVAQPAPPASQQTAVWKAQADASKPTN